MTAGPHERSLARAAADVAGTRIVLLVLGLGVSVLIARALGPAGRGEYALVVAVSATAVTLGHLSIEQAQVYLTSTGAGLRRLAANAVALGLVLGCLAVAGVFALSALTGYPAQEVESLLALGLGLAAVPFSMVALYANGLLVLEGRTDLVNRAALLGGGAQTALLVALGFAGRLTVTVVVAAWLLNAVLPLVVSLRHLRPSPQQLSWRLARQEAGLGLRYHGGLASLYLLLRVDVLMLAALRSDREVGLYALAVTLVELTNIATDAIATVVLRRQTTSSLADAALFTARVVGLTLVLALVAVLGLVLISPLFVPLVYGQAFSGAVPALFALAPGVVALAATRSAGGYLLRLNRPWTVTALAFTAMLVNVSLNLVLIPVLGIVGASVSSSVAYTLLAGAYVVWLRRSARLRWSSFSPLPLLGRAKRRG